MANLEKKCSGQGIKGKLSSQRRFGWCDSSDVWPLDDRCTSKGKKILKWGAACQRAGLFCMMHAPFWCDYPNYSYTPHM